MPLFRKAVPGVTKLSELEIDVDKDWATKNITNFGTTGIDLHGMVTSHASRHAYGGADELPDASLPQGKLLAGPSTTKTIPEFKVRVKEDAGGAILRDGYLVSFVRGNVADSAGQVFFPEAFSYGTYQWVAKIENPGTGRDLYVGFAEEAPSQYKDSIFLYNRDGGYRAETFKAGTSTLTTLTEDWTVDRTFKVVWSSTKVEFYRDGVLIATHTTNIPTVKCIAFMEAFNGPTPPATHGYSYGKDWVKLA